MSQIFAGYALATRPIALDTVSTGIEGLETGETSVDSGGFELPAYYARPAGNVSSPVVLVIHEIFGVHEHIKDVCRRLAKQGYYAIAPELYARQGNVAGISDMQQIIQNVVSKVPDPQVLSDLDATVEHVRDSGKGDTSRLGVVGFCWGGRIVWLYSAHQPKLIAGAAWYGKLTAGPYSKPETQPKQPVDVAGQLHGAILGLYGGKDEGIPLSTVAQMRDALKAAGKNRCQIVVYPEAGHAFNADYRPSYHEASAKDAWAKMLDWFDKHGLGR
ncbi:MAG: dienelactone hydrolase family protein [Acidobacteriaceae bacterium]|nr:dienelactone hydrolase family protein [Acidobacteriaceae bacterium]